MSIQTDTMRELIARFNARQPIDVSHYFTEDFELDDPASGVRRSGLAGARDMVHALETLADGLRLEIVAMIEQGDLVAVRYAATSASPELPAAAMMAFYRFVDGRIAEDWGVSTRKAWQR